MTDTASGRPGSMLAERLLGIGIFALTAFQLYQSSQVATTPRGTPAREALQQMHYSVGLLVLVLVIPRLYLWWQRPRPARPLSVPLSADAFAREICLLFYVTALLFASTGPINAWANGHHVTLFGLPIPALVEPGYRLTMLFGYLHSAIGMWVFGLLALGIGVAIYQRLRYKAPLLRMLPGFAWSRSGS